MLQTVQVNGAPEVELRESGPGAGPAQPAAVPILVHYWQIFLRWKWVIAGILAASLAIALIVTLLTTPVYTATSRVDISREQQNVTAVEGLESREAFRDDEFYQTQYSLLEARSLAERVARARNLASNDAFFEAHGVSQDGGLFGDDKGRTLGAEERRQREQLAIGLLLQHVSIRPIPRSRLVDIRYTSASPTMSAEIANAWAEQFIAGSLDRRFASTADARRFLEGRLAELGQRLEASERAVVRYAREHDIVSLGRVTGPDGRVESDRTLVANDLEALNAALTQATADRIAWESRLRNAGANSTESLQSVALAGLRQRRAEVASERQRLLVQFEPGYPAIQALDQQLRVIDASISREESRIGATRSTQYQEALRREATLRQDVQELTGRLNRQRSDSIQYNIYQREADTNRQLYDSLLQRYKEIGVAGVSLSNIAIVDRAQVPGSPSAPNLLVNLALALFAGVGLSFLTVLGLEQIDEGLRDPASVGRLLGLPLLGSVPDMPDESPKEALADAKSDLSEAYLSVETSLAFSTDHGFPKTLMVTSSRAAEGKSTSSLGLATVLARTGAKVLLIDADMRSPSVHEFFDHPNKQGLSNFLAGDDNWRQMVLPTPQAGLRFLPAGPTPPNAAELLSGERMRLLMREGGGDFDHIIVDSPPIMGLADAPLLSRSVEGCAFVVEAEGVPVRGLRSALARLQQAQARIYGVIVTRLNQKRVGYGYGYGSGYGKSDEE